MGKASKDKRDAYYRLAKEQGWRARSAFKLLQLNEEFNLFEGVTRVVDLCAAPGSWSQVLSRVLIQGETFDPTSWAPEEAKDEIQSDERYRSKLHRSDGDDAAGQHEHGEARAVKIVAIDLQPMMPLEGITTLAADITHPSTVPLLLKALDPETSDRPASASASHAVDLVLSDGAPDAIALHDLDMYVQSQLLFAALNLALCVLKRGGTFVSKIFRGKDVDVTYARLRAFFRHVTVAKPRSSRASSIEAFVVCRGFDVPAGFEPSLERPLRPDLKLPATTTTTTTTPCSSRKSRCGATPTRTVREDGIVELNFGSEGDDEHEHEDGGNPRWIPPFVACGHPSSYDSDATYRLPKDRASLDPVQPPTAPPYKRALEMRRAAGGAYGKTKK